MIPKRLSTRRKAAGISQEKLGLAAGIDQYTAKNRVCKYEAGTNEPKFKLVCEFAKVLNAPPCYFYIEEDEFAEAVLRLWQHKEIPVLENADNLALREAKLLAKQADEVSAMYASKIHELSAGISRIADSLERKTRRLP